MSIKKVIANGSFLRGAGDLLLGTDKSLHHREADRIRRGLSTGTAMQTVQQDWAALGGDLRRAIDRERSAAEKR